MRVTIFHELCLLGIVVNLFILVMSLNNVVNLFAVYQRMGLIDDILCAILWFPNDMHWWFLKLMELLMLFVHITRWALFTLNLFLYRINRVAHVNWCHWLLTGFFRELLRLLTWMNMVRIPWISDWIWFLLRQFLFGTCTWVLFHAVVQYFKMVIHLATLSYWWVRSSLLAILFILCSIILCIVWI